MNQYATLARQHWRTHLPTRYAALTDPEVFFIRLGEEAMAEIEELAAALEGEDQPAETFPAKVARLTTARADAESTILRELILLPVETD